MPDYKGFLRTMMIIHLALVVGQIAFLGVCLGLSEEVRIEFAAGNDPFFYLVPLTALIAVSASFALSKKLVAEAAGKTDVNEKLNAYRTALIIRYALIEGPSLFGLVAFLLSSNLYYALVSGFLILLMILMRPSKLKTELDLGIQLPTDL